MITKAFFWKFWNGGFFLDLIVSKIADRTLSKVFYSIHDWYLVIRFQRKSHLYYIKIDYPEFSTTRDASVSVTNIGMLKPTQKCTQVVYGQKRALANFWHPFSVSFTKTYTCSYCLGSLVTVIKLTYNSLKNKQKSLGIETCGKAVRVWLGHNLEYFEF